MSLTKFHRNSSFHVSTKNSPNNCENKKTVENPSYYMRNSEKESSSNNSVLQKEHNIHDYKRKHYLATLTL